MGTKFWNIHVAIGLSAILLSIGAPAFAGKVVKLTVRSDGDNLAFYQKELTTKSGQTTAITYTNASKKSAGLQHNFVVAKPGTEADIINASMSAGADKGWLAESPNIIAHTKLLNAGESETITFPAPAPGDYPYFCSFPGHGTMMKGVLHVKK